MGNSFTKEKRKQKVIDAGRQFPLEAFGNKPTVRASAIVDHLSSLPPEERIYISLPTVRKYLGENRVPKNTGKNSKKSEKKKKANKVKISKIYTAIKDLPFKSEQELLEAILDKLGEHDINISEIRDQLALRIYRDQARFYPERKKRVINGFKVEGKVHVNELAEYLINNFRDNMSHIGIKLCLKSEGLEPKATYNYSYHTKTRKTLDKLTEQEEKRLTRSLRVYQGRIMQVKSHNPDYPLSLLEKLAKKSGIKIQPGNPDTGGRIRTGSAPREI